MTVETFLSYVPPAIAIGTTLMAVVVAAMLVYVVWRWSLLKAQSAVLAEQQRIIEQQQDAIEGLKEAREDDARHRRIHETEMQSLKDEIAELRGELKGQRDLAKAIVEVIGETKICLVAEGCGNRVLPSV